MTTEVASIAELDAPAGRHLGPSEWREVDQPGTRCRLSRRPRS
jgi:hypothetical protein